METKSVKVELLCQGLMPNDLLADIYTRQNPFDDKRTGNAGLHLLLGDEQIPVNVPVFHRYTKLSPYELSQAEDQLFITSKGTILARCKTQEGAPWYGIKLFDATPASKVLIVEGRRTLIGTVRSYCDYFKSHKPCAFCAIGPYTGIREKNPAQIAETVKLALSHRKDYELHLTGGNVINRPDRGLLDYIEVVRAVRRFSDIPISIEASPPEDISFIDLAIDAGVNAFSINLEIWDEKLRKIFCPLKSKITKKEYLSSWERVILRSGPNQVCSVLVCGIESPESIMKGVRFMIDQGVIPTIIPLRRNDGSLLSNFRSPCPEIVAEISSDVGEQMRKAGMLPKSQPGCTRCAACSSEQDYM